MCSESDSESELEENPLAGLDVGIIVPPDLNVGSAALDVGDVGRTTAAPPRGEVAAVALSAGGVVAAAALGAGGVDSTPEG